MYLIFKRNPIIDKNAFKNAEKSLRSVLIVLKWVYYLHGSKFM